MSEFAGPITEFSSVSIDRFNNENLKSTVYFLSHCHSDHMVGLNEPELFERLKRYNFKIYCHKISAALLSALPHYRHLTPFVIPLEAMTEVTINVSIHGGNFDEINSYPLTVTLIPAGHCPGSVMFLLASTDISVLFTGDFRFEVGQVKRIKYLYDDLRQSAVRNFDNIYVDTTFCKLDTCFLPSRESCLSSIFQAVSDWIFCSSQNNFVHFRNKTRFGYEFLMKELATKFNTKIHVSVSQYQLYKFVPSIQTWLTLDAESTKIHFCTSSSIFEKNLKLPCQHSLRSFPRVLTIIPTAMFFTKNEIMPSRLVKAVSEKTIRCCYSTHSSTDEIIDFLSNLKFKNITPFVRPDKETSIESVKSLILNKLRSQFLDASKDAKTEICHLWQAEIRFEKKVKRGREIEAELEKQPVPEKLSCAEFSEIQTTDQNRTEVLIDLLNTI